MLGSRFQNVERGGKTFVGEQQNKRASEDIGGGEIGRKNGSSKRPKRTVSCGPKAVDALGKNGLERNVSKLTETPAPKIGHRQKVSDEIGICQQKVSNLIEISLPDELNPKIGHRQKVSNEIGICQQKLSDLIEISLSDELNLIELVTGTSKGPRYGNHLETQEEKAWWTKFWGSEKIM
jgi:hypothetical protein